MKIKTADNLHNKIDHEVSWRTTDLVRLRSVIIKSDGPLKKTMLRASIPILYAHWEGFVKESAISMVNFIAIRRLKYKELTRGILATFISDRILSSNNKLFDKAISIIDLFENKISDRSNIKSIPTPIDTKSNLNSVVLKEIVEILELDYEKFRAYENLIDGQLLEARNKIAHGEYTEIEWDFYNQLHEKVIELIKLVQIEILNCIAKENYKRVIIPHIDLVSIASTPPN